ncbi:MAG: sugar phosphate isomerase/epimerase [Bryobacterales bacterium]|nr:sugar phosphate isomerase/epimerase [Bryobacterales bacterium]
MMNRRTFTRALATTPFLGAPFAGLLDAAPLGMPIGCQLYPVRDRIPQDFEGLLKELHGLGYRTIETCSPPGYPKSGFTALESKKASEIKQAMKAAGLRCISCHYPMRELRAAMEERIAYAVELGLEQMVISSFGVPKDAKLADWSRVADEANKLGERARKAGLQLGFHNHNTEFAKLDGTLIYDELMRVFDPKLVKGQFQVTTIALGYDPPEMIEKYAGRIVSMHLSDWSATEKKMAPVGKGSIDWKRLFAAAKKAGVKNYFVEMDMESMKQSIAFLSKFKA